MRTLKLMLAVLATVLLTSCLEINEEVVINENGSGQLTSSMDLSQLIDMLQAMGGEEFEKRKDEKIDSTINLKDITDTAKNMTAEQKELMRDGKMHIKMNMDEKVFKLDMQYPFNNLERLQKLTTAISDGGIGLGSMMKGAMQPKQPAGLDQPNIHNSDDPEMDQLMGIFDYNISNGLIKKTVNAEKLKKVLDNPKMAEMQQGADMGIEVIYNVTYKLPRPVKKVDNPKAKISDDKKTVTIRQNLMDIFTKSDQFAFTIEY
ncbi:MAG TPA: hypothetical protein VD996_07735 [Chitinophagaceae bacterium]|nr:hypothetical protein [Chitinophagaceae bacterium]